MTGVGGESDGDIVTAFLKQYYPSAQVVPREVILPAVSAEDAGVLELWLSSLREGRVRLRVPLRGEKRRLLELAGRNARQSLEKEALRQIREDQRTGGALRELAQLLGLPASARPHRMLRQLQHSGDRPGGVDGGVRGGTAGPQGVSALQDPDGGGRRRFRHHGRGHRPAVHAGAGGTTAACGAGRGPRRRRLFAVARPGHCGRRPRPAFGGPGGHACAGASSASPPWGWPKGRRKYIWRTSRSPSASAVRPRRRCSCSRARNEAHRFAVAYHRSLRGQRGLRSQLDAVPGIGPVRRKELLRAFPSMAAMRAASEVELAAVRGMNKTAARRYGRF